MLSVKNKTIFHAFFQNKCCIFVSETYTGRSNSNEQPPIPKKPRQTVLNQYARKIKKSRVMQRERDRGSRRCVFFVCAFWAAQGVVNNEIPWLGDEIGYNKKYSRAPTESLHHHQT